MLRRLVLLLVVAALAIPLGWGLWAGAAWLRYGHPDRAALEDAAITRFLPRCEVAERHERIVEATPAAVFRVAQTFSLEQSPVIRSIFRAREALFGEPHKIESPTSLPLVTMARAIGWGLLDSLPSRELVFGAVTQPWRGDVHFRPIAADRFAAFDSAGYAKIVWAIAVDSLGPTRSRVRTETRVATTDAISRRRFRRYWSIYSPGIVWIRRMALRVIANQAMNR
jgi:hypothetical protein